MQLEIRNRKKYFDTFPLIRLTFNFSQMRKGNEKTVKGVYGFNKETLYKYSYFSARKDFFFF